MLPADEARPSLAAQACLTRALTTVPRRRGVTAALVAHGDLPGLAAPPWAMRGMLDAVDRVTNQTISRKMEPRRAGDPAELVSDPARIRATLPWQPQYADLGQIITHALQWERKLAELREE